MIDGIVDECNHQQINRNIVTDGSADFKKISVWRRFRHDLFLLEDLRLTKFKMLIYTTGLIFFQGQRFCKYCLLL